LAVPVQLWQLLEEPLLQVAQEVSQLLQVFEAASGYSPGVHDTKQVLVTVNVNPVGQVTH